MYFDGKVESLKTMLHLNQEQKLIYSVSKISNHWFSELVDGKELECPPGSETVLKIINILVNA